MSNLVVVAIPEEMDRVWKLSSEQVPHLTLLFLGEADNNPHVQDIVQFVEHAVTVSEHGPFYLDIDHRGTLGPDEADVLFFSKRSWNLKWIQNFRAQLLQDSNIKTAYDSTTQYDEWQPHLTMGYPPTPAKEMGENDHPLYSVCFDRIAVWDTDYAGPEFRLEWPERELDGPLAVAYADQQKAALVHYGSKEEYIKHVGGTQSVLDNPDIAATIKAKLQSILDDVTGDADGDINLFGDPVIQTKIRSVLSDFYRDPNVDNAVVYSALGDVIQHHGVKGMKWGVRKEQIKSGAKATGRAIKKTGKAIGRGLAALGAQMADSHWQSSTYSDVKHEAVHNHVAKKLDNNIAKLQNSPKYRGKNLKADSNLRKTYYEDVAKVTDSAYKSGVKEIYGENYTGTKTAHYVNDVRGPRIEVRDKHTGEKVSESPLPSMKEIQRQRAEANGTMGSAGSGTSKFGHAAATDFPDLSIDLKLDDNGQISGVGFVKSETPAVHGAIFAEGLMHRATSPGEQFVLEHHGVKGMKWGVRRDATGGGGTGAGIRRGTPTPVAPHAESKVPHGSKRKTTIDINGGENHPATKDALKVAEAQAKLRKSGPKALTNQELRDVAQRVQLEQQAMHATRHGANKFVRETLTNQGKQAVNQIIRSKIDARIRRGNK